MTVVIAFIIGATVGCIMTSFFTAKAVTRAENKVEDSEHILRQMIHENIVLSLPNFDADKFYKCTGIKV